MKKLPPNNFDQKKGGNVANLQKREINFDVISKKSDVNTVNFTNSETQSIMTKDNNSSSVLNKAKYDKSEENSEEDKDF